MVIDVALTSIFNVRFLLNLTTIPHTHTCISGNNSSSSTSCSGDPNKIEYRLQIRMRCISHLLEGASSSQGRDLTNQLLTFIRNRFGNQIQSVIRTIA